MTRRGRPANRGHELRFTDITSESDSQAAAEALWGGQHWTRITESDLGLSVLNGTYRKTLTAEDVEAAGVPPVAAANNSGVWTITLADGHFEDTLVQPGVPEATCTGSYTIDGDTFRFAWTPGSTCSGDFTATWSLQGGELWFTDVDADALLDRTIWSLGPFVRID